MKSFTRILGFGKTKTDVPPGIKTKRGILFDNDGWVVPSQFLSPSARIVYVSTSEGDDSLANNNAYGRSYYLPNDPVIGSDPTNPIGPIDAHLTLNSAYTAARCIPTGAASRRPDWILFKRGDTFDFSTLISGTAYPGSRFLSEGTGAGPTSQERRIFGAYGNINVDRPKIQNANVGSAMWGGTSVSKTPTNVYIFSLEFLDSAPYGNGLIQFLYGPANILFEDIYMEAGGGGSQQLTGSDSLYVVRRCVISNSYQLAYVDGSGVTRDPHVQGMYLGQADRNWISECIFDMNGYKENPRKPSTWTGGVSASGSRGELAFGSGVQPSRTFFDRNCYMSSYEELDFEGNIISRGGGGGCVQMRVGGTARNNAFLWNQSALAIGGSEASRTYFQNAPVENNLVLHDDHMIPPGAYGTGLLTGVGDQEGAIIRSNLVLHFHRPTNGAEGMIAGAGIPQSPAGLPKENALIMHIDDNVLISKHNTLIRLETSSATGNVQYAKVGRNAFIKLQGGGGWVGVSAANTQFEIGTANTGGNHYYAPSGWREFANSAWQSSGKDTASTIHDNLVNMTTALGWQANAWEKDIVSYMQHVDPTYVPDENVTVDFAAPIEYRRANAPNVWYVLQNSQLYGGGTTANMAEADAKLTARRYHACITFLNRAKANRKGSWDDNYTANAINNYFRTQFNKPLVSKSV